MENKTTFSCTLFNRFWSSGPRRRRRRKICKIFAWPHAAKNPIVKSRMPQVPWEYDSWAADLALFLLQGISIDILIDIEDHMIFLIMPRHGISDRLHGFVWK